ncbi:hypothetical protein TSUD_361630 [Trifolium subterraneum]|uniref:SLC26A/SulP transporter domain-containing protein n=1 Tax=Trifolium subterraneum TaxID=3900 RepID=A0A2Z6MS87_TRISU|nr:hypothetical protein TSUD_361630 [Trifolium subterraneum]
MLYLNIFRHGSGHVLVGFGLYNQVSFLYFPYNRLGFLVDFMSHAAIVGFVAGAAIVIGLQQIKGLFGIIRFMSHDANV